MLDIRRLRADPDGVRAALAKRSPEVAPNVDSILDVDERRRAALGEVNELKASRNEASRRIGEVKRSGGNADSLMAETRSLGERIGILDRRTRELNAQLTELLLATPNTPLDEVPAGDEDQGLIVKEWGELPSFSFEPKPHWEVGELLGGLDLPRGSKVSGSGFPVLRGELARLQRALISYFIDVHVQEHGYTELRVPYLVTAEAMTGTAQLPKFSDQSYLTDRDGLWLVPTAEVPVTNLHRGELLAAADLPMRYVAYSPCFRREAGAAGRDTRGLLRVHQFDKVELVRYETPERARTALEELTRQAETLLERLGLAYRRVLLAAGDIGAGNAMTYDLDVWAPGVEKWLEVSSCSTFGDYQARRANLRYRERQGEKPRFLHTLNGSALALPRVLAALLETGQREDGDVELPEAVHRYFGGQRLSRTS